MYMFVQEKAPGEIIKTPEEEIEKIDDASKDIENEDVKSPEKNIIMGTNSRAEGRDDGVYGRILSPEKLARDMANDHSTPLKD